MAGYDDHPIPPDADRGRPDDGYADPPAWVFDSEASAPDRAQPGQSQFGQPQPGQSQPGQPYPALPPYPGHPYPGQPFAGPVYGWPAAKPSALPDGPREYQQMLRGPRHRGWKPVLTILLFAGLYLVVSVVLMVIFVLGAWAFGDSPFGAIRTLSDLDHIGPFAFAFTNLSLIVLIPVTMLAVWIVHRVPPRYLVSVEGRFRWRWFGRCLLVLVPLWLVYLVVTMLIDPSGGDRPRHWVILMIMVVLTTPLQAAGEEFAFRGFLTQVIGSWFRVPLVSLLVPLPFAVGLFALAHGSLHGWVLVDLGSFALANFILTWRTGGLEAGIALHAVNNVLLMLLTLWFGGFEQGFVQSDTTGSPGAAFVSVGVNALAAALVLWQASRAKINRLYRPEPATAPLGPAQAAPAPIS